MNCEQAREFLSAYFDGELRADARHDEVQEHVMGCDACAHQVRGYKQLRAIVAVQPAPKRSSPSWESMASRLDKVSVTEGDTNSGGTAGRDVKPAHALSLDRSRRRSIGGLVTLAAIILLFVYFYNSQHREAGSMGLAGIASINLQPLIELFGIDAEQALATLTSQHPSVEVTLAQAEAEFGRPTFVQVASRTQSLPGNAQPVATKLLQFPACQCGENGCTCGPHGCHCVACVCERPDGSTYLVLEQCRSQSVTCGDLPVQVVKRGDRYLQQVETQGTMAISWEQDGERLTAIGVRGPAEIDSLLTRN